MREGDSKSVLEIVRLFNGMRKPVLKEMFRSLQARKKTNWVDKSLLTKEIVRGLILGTFFNVEVQFEV